MSCRKLWISRGRGKLDNESDAEASEEPSRGLKRVGAIHICISSSAEEPEQILFSGQQSKRGQGVIAFLGLPKKHRDALILWDVLQRGDPAGQRIEFLMHHPAFRLQVWCSEAVSWGKDQSKAINVWRVGNAKH